MRILLGFLQAGMQTSEAKRYFRLDRNEIQDTPTVLLTVCVPAVERNRGGKKKKENDFHFDETGEIPIAAQRNSRDGQLGLITVILYRWGGRTTSASLSSVLANILT